MSQLTVGRIGPTETVALSQLLDGDRVLNVYLRSELRLLGTAAPWWCVSDGSELRAAALTGPLTVPCIPRVEDAAALAEATRSHVAPHLVVGPRDAVIAMTAVTAQQRVPRAVRDPQPVMVVDRRRLRLHAPAPLRPATRRDVPLLADAAAAMHEEEMAGDSAPPDAAAWRARMAQLVDRGWSWAWIDSGRVLFKAELSAWTPDVVQVQGVFTDRGARGRGVATAGMAALCALLLDTVPLVSLYVNADNAVALRLYRRLGFEEHGAFATVMY